MEYDKTVLRTIRTKSIPPIFWQLLFDEHLRRSCYRSACLSKRDKTYISYHKHRIQGENQLFPEKCRYKDRFRVLDFPLPRPQTSLLLENRLAKRGPSKHPSQASSCCQYPVAVCF